MEAYVSAVPAYEEVVRLMKVEFTEKVTGKVRCRSSHEVDHAVFVVAIISSSIGIDAI
jgi:phage baseplate assembly protein W